MLHKFSKKNILSLKPNSKLKSVFSKLIMVLNISILVLEFFLKEKDIHHTSTCRDTTQQNGLDEHKNQHLLEVARSFFMFSMHMPKYLWGEADLTSCYLINRMSSHVLKYDTPLQTLRKKISKESIDHRFTPKSFWLYGLCSYTQPTSK